MSILPHALLFKLWITTIRGARWKITKRFLSTCKWRCCAGLCWNGTGNCNCVYIVRFAFKVRMLGERYVYSGNFFIFQDSFQTFAVDEETIEVMPVGGFPGMITGGPVLISEFLDQALSLFGVELFCHDN